MKPLQGTRKLSYHVRDYPATSQLFPSNLVGTTDKFRSLQNDQKGDTNPLRTPLEGDRIT